jgi:hypothetical protein
VNCEVLFVGLMNPISIPLSTAVSLKIPQGWGLPPDEG